MQWQTIYRKPGSDPFPPMTLLFAFAMKWKQEKLKGSTKVSEAKNAFDCYASIAQHLN